VSELPPELRGKECFGPAPSRTYPGKMWNVLLRVRADGKQVETWSLYSPPGLGTKEWVATYGPESRGTLFFASDDGTYAVPIKSPNGYILSLFFKIVDNQFRFTTGLVDGKGDCVKLP
jgi:hypothetical protein